MIKTVTKKLLYVNSYDKNILYGLAYMASLSAVAYFYTFKSISLKDDKYFLRKIKMLRFKDFIQENFTDDEVKIANATSRNSGAIGAKAITPRHVENVASKDHDILDFGSGKDAAHAKALRAKGFKVTAHEFGSNQNENHDRAALTRKYDHVYASNVLNVQSTKAMLSHTLDQIHGVLKPGGRFTGNFPMSPRKAPDIDHAHVENELKARFKKVDRVGGTRQTPLFHAEDPV